MAPWEYAGWTYPNVSVPYIQYMPPCPMVMAPPVYYPYVPDQSSSYYFESTPYEKGSIQDEFRVHVSQKWLKESSSSEW
jgi:hypothetical protein